MLADLLPSDAVVLVALLVALVAILKGKNGQSQLREIVEILRGEPGQSRPKKEGK